MNTLSESTYLVLLALYHEPLHGYGIIKGIEEISDGAYIIAAGTLYGVLKNLEKQCLIETIKEEKGSRKKRHIVSQYEEKKLCILNLIDTKI